ncbi:MAG: hypothetical protein JO017_09535 [Actinobacteria bacterium]|nr:hypothetical protein [Actinomycetota bacterium]
MPTAARAAKNEGLFREVNERIVELEENFGRRPDERTEFVCECSIADCIERVPLTLEEYQSVREQATYFLVVPGHVDEEHERVIKDGGHYFVVEKTGLAGEIAEEDAA